MPKVQALTFYRSIRITIALTLAMAIWLVFHLERGYWIAMTLMIVYMPFEPGLVNNRIKYRLAGTMMGLLLGLLLVGMLRVNEGFALILPIIVLVALYYSFVHYLYSAILITMAVMLLFSMLPTPGMSAGFFMLARFLDTFIACTICFIAETVFRPRPLIFHTICNSLCDIFSAYAKHFLLIEKGLKEGDYAAISVDEATKFNNGLLALKQNVDLNKQKLPTIRQSQLEACLTSIFAIRENFASIQHLILRYPEKTQLFYEAYQDNINQIKTILTMKVDNDTEIEIDKFVELEKGDDAEADNVLQSDYEERMRYNFNELIDNIIEFRKVYAVFRNVN